MRNYKKQELFLKRKREGVNSPRIWVDLGKDYDMCRINPGMSINKCLTIICDGVYYEDTYHMSSPAYPDGEMEVYDISPELKDYINFQITSEMRMLSLDDIKMLSLYVLNSCPQLHSGTCMGWTDFDDKSKDPNWYDGVYVFPDGNYYTICLKHGELRVYPGKGDGFGLSTVSLPLTVGEINLQQWADKCNGNSVFIEFKKSNK